MPSIPVKCNVCGKINQMDSTLSEGFCMYCGGAIRIDTDRPDVDAIRELAEKGDAQAQFELAEIYRFGKGVVQDNYVALEWFTKAAEQGDPYAMYHLGIMYSSGLGTPQNCAKAIKCFADAREHGLGRRPRASCLSNPAAITSAWRQTDRTAKVSDWCRYTPATARARPRRRWGSR